MTLRPNQRKNKRTYVLNPAHIILKDHPFQLNDISNEGIGILLEEGTPRFFIGERIEKIPIPLKSGAVCLTGVVSHISVNAKGTVCGIRFLLGADEYLTVVQFKEECNDPFQR